MVASDLRLLPDSADILIEPLAPSIDPGAAGLPLAGGRLSFSRVRLHIHDDGERPACEDHEVAALDAVRARLPATLAARFEARLAALTATRPPIMIKGRGLPLGFGRPLVMGIINVTPDSFSDGGRHADAAAAIAHGRALLASGADILDIGGESTRPGAKPVWEEEERQRVIPVIRALAAEGALISVDSRKAGVMAAALEAGAHIVNDVSALRHDPESAAVARAHGAPVILMHAQGDPESMQHHPHYEDVVREIFDWFGERVAYAVEAGIERSRIILDPGIGFGKTVRHNLDLLNALAVFHGHGLPLLLGASRKRFIGALSAEEPAGERLGGSLMAALQGLAAGVQILRVHDVGETAQAVRVREGLFDAAHMRKLESCAMEGESLSGNRV